MHLQLKLWFTKPGIKNLCFLSPGPWNVKERAERQLQTITKHFQWSCKMPWIHSTPPETWTAPLWNSSLSLAKHISCPSLAGSPHQTLWRLCLLTPWNKEPLSLFRLELLLALLSSCLPDVFLSISWVSAHHNSQMQTWATGEPQWPRTAEGNFPFVLSSTSELIVKGCPHELSYDCTGDSWVVVKEKRDFSEKT